VKVEGKKDISFEITWVSNLDAWVLGMRSLLALHDKRQLFFYDTAIRVRSREHCGPRSPGMLTLSTRIVRKSYEVSSGSR
jgi:hypothetical protein